jgi:hypothetical protein
LREAEVGRPTLASVRLAQALPARDEPSAGDPSTAMQTTLSTYRMIATNIDRSLAATASQQSVATATEYYKSHIGDVKSIDDFMKDTRLYNYAMTAFNLDDMAYAKAFMRKVLTEGVSDSTSFANKLTDDRFVQLATTFNFAELGAETTSTTAVQQTVVDRYTRQTLETNAGQDNEAVQLALYFQREAPNVKSVYGLLGDTALWTVVQTAFGFPDSMANADIDLQAKAVSQQLDIADLSDPTKLEKLITRFAAAWDAQNVTTSDPILALFNNTGQNASVDYDLLYALTSLKHGGS